LGDSGESFQRGVVPGAFLGAFIGLVPGMLLVLVLGGGQYGVGLLEVISFIAMSIAAGAGVGALIGGAMAVALVAGQRALGVPVEILVVYRWPYESYARDGVHLRIGLDPNEATGNNP